MTVGGFWFRELPGVPDWAQDIRIIQEFQGDLIRTVTWTVRISATVFKKTEAGHTRGNSADLIDTAPSLWYDGAHSEHAGKYLIKRSFITIA